MKSNRIESWIYGFEDPFGTWEVSSVVQESMPIYDSYTDEEELALEEGCLRIAVECESDPTKFEETAGKVEGNSLKFDPIAAEREEVEACSIDQLRNSLLITACHHRPGICEARSKSPKIIVAGKERRFCQPCSRFHELSEIDDGEGEKKLMKAENRCPLFRKSEEVLLQDFEQGGSLIARKCWEFPIKRPIRKVGDDNFVFGQYGAGNNWNQAMEYIRAFKNSSGVNEGDSVPVQKFCSARDSEN
ncbi:hypothetical protein ACS0TY_027082 [Phlomoides rotata]